MQELWQTFVHALLPGFTTPLDVGCGRRPPPPVPVAGRRSVRRPARLSDQHAEGLEDRIRLDEADRRHDRRDADHDVGEEPRDTEQAGGDAAHAAERPLYAMEIGRAAVRERVWQYE